MFKNKDFIGFNGYIIAGLVFLNEALNAISYNFGVHLPGGSLSKRSVFDEPPMEAVFASCGVAGFFLIYGLIKAAKKCSQRIQSEQICATQAWLSYARTLGEYALVMCIFYFTVPLVMPVIRKLY